VLSFAPRLSPKLLEAIVRYDDRKVPIAETYRRVGREAERLGLPRPSYQRVRVLVHAARRARGAARPPRRSSSTSHSTSAIRRTSSTS
jgi:hypothetical protein